MLVNHEVSLDWEEAEVLDLMNLPQSCARTGHVGTTVMYGLTD